MKTILQSGLFIALLFLFSSLRSQTLPELTRQQPEKEKAKLFERIPSRFAIGSSAFEKIFSFRINEKVVLPLGAGSFLEGTVTEKVQQSPEVTSINIIASNYQGALFTISRIAIAGQPVSYAGRLVSIKHGDAFMMTMQGKELVFAKQKQSSLVAE
jgi:hypothetical protein